MCFFPPYVLLSALRRLTAGVWKPQATGTPPSLARPVSHTGEPHHCPYEEEKFRVGSSDGLVVTGRAERALRKILIRPFLPWDLLAERSLNSGLAAAVAKGIHPDRARSRYSFPIELEVKRGCWNHIHLRVSADCFPRAT